MVVRGVLAAILVASCGRVGFDAVPGDGSGPLEDPPEFTAGSRLRPNVQVSDDGVTLLIGWYDTQLDTDCYFTQIDGDLRCFPNETALISFSDPACTQPYVGVIPTCLRTSRTVQATPGGSLQAQLYRTGAPELLANTYSLSGGTCMVQSTNVMASPLLEVLAPSAFVGAHERNVPHGRLGYVVVEADDGTVEKRFAPYDPVRDTQCSWHEVADGSGICLPLSASQIGGLTFADAACTQKAVRGYQTPNVLFEENDAVCQYPVTTFERGGALSSTYLIDPMTSQCTNVALAQDEVAFAVGPEIPLDTFATASRIVPATGPRVRKAEWTSPDGLHTSAGLWDTANNEYCSPVPMGGDAPDQLRCGPLLDFGRQAESNATCSMSIGNVIPRCTHSWIARYEPPTVGGVGCAGFQYDLYLYDVPVTTPAFVFTTSCVPFPDAGHPLFAESSTKLDRNSLVRYDFATQ